MSPETGHDRGRVQARGEEQSQPDRRVRRDFDAQRVRHAGDAQELRDAGVPHLGLNIGHSVRIEAQARFIGGIPFFSRGDRDRTFARDSRETGDVLGLDRRFDEAQTIRREFRRERDGFVGRKLPMQIDHQFGIVPDAFAQRRDLLDDALATHDRVYLECVMALLLESARHCCALGDSRRGQTREISGDQFALTLAEKAPQRKAAPARPQVPQRDVEGGDRIDVKSAEASAYAHETV